MSENYIQKKFILPLVNLLKQGMDPSSITEKDLQYILGQMHKYKSIDYTLNLARFYIDRAKSHLRKAEFPAPRYIEHLDAVADYIYSRHAGSSTTATP